MAKKSKSAGRSHAQKKADEKLFLKLLENEASKKRQPGKQTPIKKSGRRIGGNIEKANRKGKQQQKNVSSKAKVSIPSKTDAGRRNVKSTKIGTVSKRAESSRLRIEQPRKKRGTNISQINFEFEKVRAIDKKINLFKTGAGDAIKKELKKRGGKPPRGIIVTVFDKQGREHTQISPLDFVVNKTNVENFVGNMLDKMKVDFMAWKDGHKIKSKRKPRKRRGRLRQDEQAMMDTHDALGPGEGGTEENPYGDYNPDDIASVTIKFIL